MAQAQRPLHVLQRALDLYYLNGMNSAKASIQSGLNNSTYRHQLAEAKRKGLTPSPEIERADHIPHLKQRITRLEGELKTAQQERLDHALIKQRIIGIAQEVNRTETPAWLLNGRSLAHDHPGVPTVMVSDLHWAEVVDPKQINNVNRYNLEIANKRLQRLAERTLRLLGILSPKFEYPGIVVPLGGDMITGNIHDELTATNEVNSMPAVLDLFSALGTFITTLHNRFGKVFLPCVTGNHGRDTHKIWAKDRHHTSFDWLLYCFLAKHFEGNKDITFYIPDGPDAYYRVYEHRYLLTHGDQFRGGDGMIGALGPILRGDHKKRSRNSQIDMEYDTLMMGHWHQDIFMRRVIVNNCLKGYDEYAHANNFPFEPPSQQLWLTHPKYRLTYRMPVLVDKMGDQPQRSWVSVSR